MNEPFQKAKTETRAGKQFYTEGQHAGKEVGTVRGHGKSEDPQTGKPAISEQDKSVQTLNTALDYARAGNWEAAWDAAKHDPSLNEGVTEEQWQEFAMKTIEERDGKAPSKPQKAKEEAPKSNDSEASKPKDDLSEKEGAKSDKEGVDDFKPKNRNEVEDKIDDLLEKENYNSAYEVARKYTEMPGGITESTFTEWAKYKAGGGEKWESVGEYWNDDSSEKLEIMAQYMSPEDKQEAIESTQKMLDMLGEDSTSKFATQSRELLDILQGKDQMNKAQDPLNVKIEEMAEVLEKSMETPKERLIKTIEELGEDGLRAKLPTLQKSEQLLLVEVLEEMKKGKAAPSQDDNYSTTYVQGNIKDTIIQEDKADDDADEKLMQQKNAEHKHQGDETPEGKEGQMIKSETLEMLDLHPEVRHEFMIKSLNAGMDQEDIMANCRNLGMDMEKACESFEKACDYMNKNNATEKEAAEIAEDAAEDAVEEHNAKLHAKNKMKKSEEDLEKAVINKEEDQLSDTDEGVKGPVRADSSRPEDLKVDKENEEAQDNVDNLNQGGLKKGFDWSDEQDTLRVGRGGQNFHFDINGYYDSVLEKAKEEPEGLEPLVKAGDQPKALDTNDILEKGFDTTQEAIQVQRLLKSNENKIDGSLVKSFDQSEIARLMGLSPEQEKELLG